ncbi:uncharacterized protein LOC143238003 isoform X2 [Tachypleus tridentatus]|uniref:uncharacterized protein LOC143238003 isoform X2 n=1 Tax=Tachypleus tridentatus TaxID=6853 RepID=UPI003FD27E33
MRGFPNAGLRLVRVVHVIVLTLVFFAIRKPALIEAVYNRHHQEQIQTTLLENSHLPTTVCRQ